MYFKIYYFKKIQSTNNHAIKMIKNNHLKGIILADEQTKGRGRQGNKWISLKGNLFMSLFFKIKQNVSIKRITIKNTGKIKKVLQKFCKKKISIKLPNDFLIEKKKICGILQETIFHNNQKFLIIGIGANIKKSPKILGYPTSHLEAYSSKKINKLTICRCIKKEYEKKN